MKNNPIIDQADVALKNNGYFKLVQQSSDLCIPDFYLLPKKT